MFILQALNMEFIRFQDQRAIISQNCINQPIFIMEKLSVLFVAGTEILNIILNQLRLRSVYK
jgi:hypothetical protein